MQEHRAAGGGDGIKGVVADIVQPPPELETAVEAVLGERLGNVIVDSHEAGVEAIQFLKRAREGRSSFIPRALRAHAPRGEVVYDASAGVATETGADPTFVPVVDADTIAAAWPKGDGVRGPMLELIGYDRQYDEVASYLLGDVLVVEDLERALTLWRETHTTKTIVTLDGEVIDPQGVVTGGSRESALTGVLEQKREIRELEQVMARLDADLEGALARQIERKQSAADLSRALEETAAALRADEMALFGLKKDLDRVIQEGSACERRREQLAAQRAEIARAITENEERLVEAVAGLEGDGRVAEEGEARAVELRGRTLALSNEVDVAVGELTTLKVVATQAEERRQNARQTLERLRADRAEEEARAARIEGTLADDEARAATLRQDAVRLRDEASLWQAEAEARARAHGERQGALEERQARLAEREALLRTARGEVARLAQTLSRLEMRSQEIVLRRTSLEEQGERPLPRRRDRQGRVRVPPADVVRRGGGEARERAARPDRAHGRDQPDRDRGVGRAAEALRLPDRAEDRPRIRHRRARDGDRAHQPDLASPLPGDVRRGQRAVRGGVPPDVRWRARQPGADRRERHARDGHRDRRQPARARRSARISSCSRAARRR
jgi:chromosome segregation protein